MNDNSPSDNTDKTVPAHSVPPVSSGMYGHGSHLLQSGMMLPPQAPGTLGVIGKYQVIKILGEGGMGQVVLAREPVTDSMVAIKLIKAEYLNKSWAVHRFLTEARHMFRMSHGSIIRVLDVSDRPEGPYFVMPFMPGGSLADKIKPGEPLPPETILPVARAVAEALQHAHTRGITHRDLKPSNILLDSDGKAQLADFGLLRTFFNDSIVDASQPQLEGTVPYMSPAVAAGKAEDTRCDIYAFGCLLYEMLTGQPPYQGPTVDAVLKQIQDGPPPPIRQLNPHAPAHLAAIAEHAMARELRDRYASMGDVVAELERVGQGKEPIGPHGREKRSAGKKKAMIAAGVVVLVGLVAFGISQLPFGKSDRTKPVISNEAPGATTVDAVVERKPGEEMVINLPNGVPMKLAWIPATTSRAWKKISGGRDYFLMGSPPDEPGRNANEDQVKVQLSQGFWMAKTECTQQQWMALMGGNPSEFKGDDLPVEMVSWNDVQEFVTKLNQTKTLPVGWTAVLPTEAKWEYACRAGTGKAYGCGNTIDAKQANFDRVLGKTCAVASYPPNAWGLYDMHGNVWERCADWMGDKLPGGTDPTGPCEGAQLVDRGGSWGDGGARCRSAERGNNTPNAQTNGLGFRVAVNPPPSIILTQGPFSYTVGDGAVTIVKYSGSGGDLVIPDRIDGLPTTGIGPGAFKGCTKLTGVTIPATVTGIASEAFSGCTSLTSVKFKGNAPAGAADASVFAGADQANVYYLPETTGWAPTFGGRPAFLQAPDYNCTINNGVVTIAKYTGPGGNVTIPDMINRLPVRGIGDGSFQDSGLTSVTIPNSVSSIGVRAFEGCTGLRDVVIGDGVANLGERAFFGCSSLAGIHIPGSVTSIGINPFDRCVGLTTLTVDASNPAYTATSDGVMFNKDCTFLVCYPASKSGSYVVPNGVTGIGEASFACSAKLTNVTISGTVTRIESWSFAACASLATACFLGNAPSLGGDVFWGADKATIHYLPTAKGWGKEFCGRPTAVWEEKTKAEN